MRAAGRRQEIYSLSKSRTLTQSGGILIVCDGPCESVDQNWEVHADRAGESSLAFSGSNQAREGRLVDALAVRGDEGRDTPR